MWVHVGAFVVIFAAIGVHLQAWLVTFCQATLAAMAWLENSLHR